jgi:hypothetical protein
MSNQKPKTRTEADKPRETRHLTEEQKQSLDLQAEAEHEDGKPREELTRRMSAEE